MPVAIVMTGVSGSGKSFVSHKLLELLQPHQMEIVAPDQFIDDVGEVLSLTYRQVFDEDGVRDACYAAADRRLKALVDKGANVLVDRTHLDVVSRHKTLSKIGPNYTIFAVNVLSPDLQKWVHHLDNRPGKAIPGDVLLGMARSFKPAQSIEGFLAVWSGLSSETGSLSTFTRTYVLPALSGTLVE